MSEAELIARHRGYAIAIARASLRGKPPCVSSSDVYQAALIGLWKWCRQHPDDTTPGWRSGLTLRVKGAIIDWWRVDSWLTRRSSKRGEKAPLHFDDDLQCAIAVDPHDDEVIARHDVGRSLEALDASSRSLVTRCCLRGISQTDVAADLGVSVPAVSVSLSRARATMRRHLERSPTAAG